MKIEIFEIKTNKVIEQQDIGDNIRGFMNYWTLQCDTKKYNWRIIK